VGNYALCRIHFNPFHFADGYRKAHADHCCFERLLPRFRLLPAQVCHRSIHGRYSTPRSNNNIYTPLKLPQEDNTPSSQGHCTCLQQLHNCHAHSNLKARTLPLTCYAFKPIFRHYLHSRPPRKLHPDLLQALITPHSSPAQLKTHMIV
jgi:hypothetical protein